MKFLSPLILLLSASACTGTETVLVKKILGNSQCGDEIASMRFIEPTQLQALMGQNQPRQTWGAKPSLPEAGQSLLLISLGQKPSGGYGLALGGEAATVQDRTLLLPLLIEEPLPNRLQTQQLTQPCLVVELQPGQYNQVRSSALPGLNAQVTKR